MAKAKASGAKFGISVKNMREWLRPDDKAIKDVVKRAHAHNAVPWLVVSLRARPHGCGASIAASI